MDNTNISLTKDCIQAINQIGQTTYQNICTGKLSVVPWGNLDWVTTIFCVVFSVGTIYVVYKILND